jgi:hypothetical protein
MHKAIVVIRHCALRAPTVFFLVRIKTIRTKNTVMENSKPGTGGFVPDRRLRADGFSSAQHRNSAITGSPIYAGTYKTPMSARIYKVYPPIRTFKARGGPTLWILTPGSANIRVRRRIKYSNKPEVSA